MRTGDDGLLLMLLTINTEYITGYLVESNEIIRRLITRQPY